MKINGKITFLVNSDFTTIELIDDDASVTFAKVKLTPEQLSSALSRLSHTDCDIELVGLNKVGKKMEHKQFEFELPRNGMSSKDSDELFGIAQELLDKTNEGWVSDGYFSSYNSFFSVGGKRYARCVVRRWV